MRFRKTERSRKKVKRMLLLVGIIAAFPIITALTFKALPSIKSVAVKFAGICAGVTLGTIDVPDKSKDTLKSHDYDSDLDYSDSDLEDSVEISDSIDEKQMRSTGWLSDLIQFPFPSSDESTPAPPNETNTSSQPSVPPIANIGPQPYPENLENKSGSITTLKYAKSEGVKFFTIPIAQNVQGAQVKNMTNISNDKLIKESVLSPEFKLTRGGEPQILIMHTHTTESYEPYQRNFYDSSFNSRTTDESKNMVSVGAEIAAQLEMEGISVIHDKTIHDYPSYNGSYDRSSVTVKAILEQYTSIKVVLDVHRDAIERENGERIAPSATVDGSSAAQVMIISGCDDGTMNMPNYMQNFRFASALQVQLEGDYPGFTRPLMFAYKKYNQNLTTGSILIEVGGHANSIDQAQYAGTLIGRSLAKLFDK